MRKYVILFLLFSLAAIIYLSFPLKSHDQFVSIKDKKFILEDKEFYPITLNYMASLQTDGKNLWACSYTGYNPGFVNRYITKDSCLMQLKADMDLIKEMGFNTVRIAAVGEEMVNKRTGELTVGARIKNERNVVFPLNNEGDYTRYFNALDDIFKAANEAGLKIIFLTRMSVDVKSTEDHLRKLADRFKDDPTILAYDIFNEPLYFDSLERNKEDVYNAVKRWNKVLKTYAPHQLSTIGLEGIREVFEWDPNILDLDFLTLHPYEYEPEQVRNELYWYGKYIKKPWMLGETAIPADNDSVSYLDQKEFAGKTLAQTYDCGGIGYAWWQYKDVEWYTFHANFMGVVSLKGETKTRKPNIKIAGTVKPIVEEFKKFDPTRKKGDCKCLENYYNYSKQKNKAFRITGFLLDEDGDPIEGGVVLAWNEWWSHSYHTISRADGSFELLSDYPFYHWMASATEYSMVRGDIKPDTAQTNGQPMPTINIGNLKLDELPFIN